VLDPIVDAVGLRAVRAKVQAEASTVCSTCGLRHLLESSCSAAPDGVDDEETPLAEGSPPEPWHGGGTGDVDASTDTGTDAAVARDDARARRLVSALMTYLGLDPGSFGEVDDRTPSPEGAAGDVGTPARWWRGPMNVRQPAAGPPSPPMRRVITFLGLDVSADETATNRHHVTAPDTAADTAATDEEAHAPADEPARTDSPIELESGGTELAATAEDPAPRYWRRADDDILYRPSRRPRSPRRAWRDRRAKDDVHAHVNE